MVFDSQHRPRVLDRGAEARQEGVEAAAGEGQGEEQEVELTLRSKMFIISLSHFF